MFGKEKRNAGESELDEVGSTLVRAVRASDDEVEAVVSSPLLYSRIRAAIAKREQASNEAPAGWLGLLAAAKLAVPAMALVAFVAGSVPWFEPAMMRKPGSVAETDPDFASFAASACALSNTQECAISSNEVLATIFAEENQERQR